MSIYTRKGDSGNSSTLDGRRLDKDHPVFEAGGALDELAAWLGMVRAALSDREKGALLLAVQEDLALIGAWVSSGEPAHLDRVAMDPAGMEAVIDGTVRSSRPPQFVFPGSSETEARLHVARTFCRRAERALAGLRAERPDPRPGAYLNRLGDLLFALALAAASAGPGP